MGACNYNPEATVDDGMCDFESCAGCTDPQAPNYDQDATIDDGSCSYEVSQSLTFDAYAFNSFSFSVDVDGESIGNIFSDSDILLVTNDNSEYFVPNYDVDQIETIHYNEGYKVFLNGAV